jgi:hypothetical protein
VVSGEASDRSRFAPSEVRRYLKALRVPLFVWSVAEEPPREWLPTVEILSAGDLRRAAEQVERELGRQLIVWLEGSYMVNRIEIDPSTAGFELVGY